MESYTIDVIKKIVSVAVHIDRQMRFENLPQLEESRLADMAIKSSRAKSVMISDALENQLVELFKNCSIDAKVLYDTKSEKLIVGANSRIRHEVLLQNAVEFINEFYVSHSNEIHAK